VRISSVCSLLTSSLPEGQPATLCQLPDTVLHAFPCFSIFVNHTLSGVQQRNLERAFQRPVLDRVGLIIEIFSQRARTAEARLQVELASLEYKASRLVRVVDAATGKKTAFGLAGEAAEIVSARERGRSGSGSGGLGGAGGQGESELQLQRRRVADRRKLLLRRLEEVRRTRAVQRAARRRSGKPQVSLGVLVGQSWLGSRCRSYPPTALHACVFC
jgi:50S ribosomal subunit-associated GTPase HflX